MRECVNVKPSDLGSRPGSRLRQSRIKRHSSRGAGTMVAIALLVLISAQTHGAIAPSAACPMPFSIACGSSLRSIQLENRRLRLVWHTRTVDPKLAERQSMEAYDRHETQLDLTQEDEARILHWVEVHSAFGLSPPSGSRTPPSYGCAFHSSLNVKCGDREIHLSWTGDSLWSSPDAKERHFRAVGDLFKLCDDIAHVRHAP